MKAIIGLYSIIQHGDRKFSAGDKISILNYFFLRETKLLKSQESGKRNLTRNGSMNSVCIMSRKLKRKVEVGIPFFNGARKLEMKSDLATCYHLFFYLRTTQTPPNFVNFVLAHFVCSWYSPGCLARFRWEQFAVYFFPTTFEGTLNWREGGAY